MAKKMKRTARPETPALEEQQPVAAAEGPLETKPGVPSVSTGVPQTGQAPASDSGHDLRRRADLNARGRPAEVPEDRTSLSPEKARRLLHDLRVHQIELEMQNDELRRTRDEAEASQARYLDLYDMAPVGYFTLSAEGLILQANLAAATLFGTAREALAEQSLTGFIFHEDQDIYYLHRKRLFDTGAPQACELRMLRADGDQFWSRLEATAAQDADGARVCRVVVSDITERKRAEETRRASEEKYRLLIENTHDIVYTFDLDGVFTFVSPSWTAHLGHAVAQVMGKSFRQFVHPDDIARCAALLAQAAKAGQLQSGIEYRVQHADGSWRWHNSNVVPVRDAAGALIGLEGIASDITERKLAQERERLAREVLDLLNRPQGATDAVRDILQLVKASTGFEAVGIRLHEGDDFPYYAANGFPDHFVQAERSLCSRDAAGEIVHDAAGNPYLEGMCGNVICGRTDPEQPFFTAAGSFWSNNTTKLLATTTDKERQTRTRNRCNAEGYQSVALIPLRSDREIIGLLQLNDRRIDRFTPELIHFLEGLGASIGIALSRKRAEEVLRETNAYLENLINYANAPIIVWDAQFRITRFNHAFEALTGRQAAEVLGQSLEVLFPPELVPSSMQSIRRTQTGERWEAVEIGIQCVDGSVRTVLWNSATLFAEDGVTPTATIAQGQDITERKRAEEALRESEERFRALVENAPDALVVQTHFRFAYVNPAAVRLYGVESADQLLGTAVLERVDPRFHDFVRKRVRLLEVGEAIHPYAELAFLRMDGSPVPVEVSSVPIRWKGDDGTLVFVRDISERKQAEQQRLDLERRLLHSQKLESLGVLAGGIAHDFNNLLMALLGNLELGLEDLSPVSSARPRVEQAVVAAKRAADLTRQMLAYSGKGHFDVRRIDLSELVEENAHMLRAAVSRNVTFNLHLSKDLPPILADAGQIQQVIMNLITNASEAMEERPGIVALATGVQACDADYLSRSLLEDKPAPGEFVWLEVTDTGCGMSAETLQRMFEPFFTTKFAGRGLGMSAVHGIVRGHQGAILAETAVGEGTTIRVLFPAAERTAGQSRIPQRDAAQPRLEDGETPSTQPTHAAVVGEESAGGAIAPLLSGTVLVVDDEPMVCELCAATLTGLGLQVLTAADGTAAMAQFREHADEVACVLLDLTMPGMDGAATFKSMRSIRPDVRVILCSGYDEQEAMQRFAGRGLAGFLQKPFQLAALRDEVRRVMQDAH